MFQNVIDYALTDAYARILLGTCNDLTPRGGFDLKVTRERFPGFAGSLLDPEDLPDLIDGRAVVGAIPFHTTHRGAPSFKAERLALYWKEDGKPHRERGPAEVIMTDVKKWHHAGALHRAPLKAPLEGFETPRPAVEIGMIKLNWLRENRFFREAGPHEIVIHNLQVFYVNGTETERVQAGVTFEFAKLSGRRVTQSEIEAFLEKNKDMEIDTMNPEFFFSNPMDEFIFLQDVGESISD